MSAQENADPDWIGRKCIAGGSLDPRMYGQSAVRAAQLAALRAVKGDKSRQHALKLEHEAKRKRKRARAG